MNPEEMPVNPFASLDLRAILDAEDDEKISVLFQSSIDGQAGETDERVVIDRKSDLPYHCLDALWTHFTNFIRTNKGYKNTFSPATLFLNTIYAPLPPITLSEVDSIFMGQIQGRDGKPFPFCKSVYNFTAPKIKRLQMTCPRPTFLSYPTVHQGVSNFLWRAKDFDLRISNCHFTCIPRWRHSNSERVVLQYAGKDIGHARGVSPGIPVGHFFHLNPWGIPEDSLRPLKAQLFPPQAMKTLESIQQKEPCSSDKDKYQRMPEDYTGTIHNYNLPLPPEMETHIFGLSNGLIKLMALNSLPLLRDSIMYGEIDLPRIEGLNEIQGRISWAAAIHEAQIPEHTMDVNFVYPNGQKEPVRLTMNSKPVYGYGERSQMCPMCGGAPVSSFYPDDPDDVKARTIMSFSAEGAPPSFYKFDIVWNCINKDGSLGEAFFASDYIFLENNVDNRTLPSSDNSDTFLFNLVNFEGYRAFCKEVEKINTRYKAHQDSLRAQKESTKEILSKAEKTKAGDALSSV